MSTSMVRRKTLTRVFLASAMFLLTSLLYARRNEVMCEIKFAGDTRVEQNAGVWVDGNYVGYLKELKGTRKVMLLPGEHVVTFRETGYKEVIKRVVLGPGQIETVGLAMEADPQAIVPVQTAEVKVSVWPRRAAVFVDGQFVGHAGELGGLGKGMLLSPGTHRFEITLPAWQPFKTEVTLLPNQEFVLKTTLLPGDIREDEAPIKEQSSNAQGSTQVAAKSPTP